MNGQTFGNYQLLKKLATGGMAEVWLARHTGIEGFSRMLVVKRILPHLADDPEFVQMFLNEAKIAARFSHQNIAQIYDLGEQNGTFFIAMEFVHGEDLGRVMRKAWSTGQWIARPLAIRMVASACEGLYYAHTKTDDRGNPLKVVHRDISPQNILVSFDGSVKLVDFGIAKAADAQSMTRSGAIKGKFAYMAPEQAGGKALDHRSDIFAIGLVLYELLTGVRPLKKDSELATLQAAMMCDIAPPSMVADVPPELDDVVMTALAKHADDRYRDARAFQMALEEFLVSQRWVATSVQLSELMATLFQDRLEEEARLGYPDPVSDDAASSPGTPLGLPPHASAQGSSSGAANGGGGNTQPGSPASDMSWEAPPATEFAAPARAARAGAKGGSSPSSAEHRRNTLPPDVPAWDAPSGNDVSGTRRSTGETRAADVTAFQRGVAERPSGSGRGSRTDVPRSSSDQQAPLRRTSTRASELAQQGAPADDPAQPQSQPPPRRTRSGVSSSVIVPSDPDDEGGETVDASRGATTPDRRRRTGQHGLNERRRSSQSNAMPEAPVREPKEGPSKKAPARASGSKKAKPQAPADSADSPRPARKLTPLLLLALVLVMGGVGFVYRAQIVEVLNSKAADEVPVSVESNLRLDVYVEHAEREGKTKPMFLGQTPLKRRAGAHIGDTLVLLNRARGVEERVVLKQNHPPIVRDIRTGYFTPHFSPQGLRDLSIFLDGEQVGTYPGPKLELVEGKHTLEVRGLQLKKPMTIDIEVKAGSESSKRPVNLSAAMQ